MLCISYSLIIQKKLSRQPNISFYFTKMNSVYNFHWGVTCNLRNVTTDFKTRSFVLTYYDNCLSLSSCHSIHGRFVLPEGSRTAVALLSCPQIASSIWEYILWRVIHEYVHELRHICSLSIIHMYFLYANALIAFNLDEENLIVIFVYYDIWLFFFLLIVTFDFPIRKVSFSFLLFFFSLFFVVSL